MASPKGLSFSECTRRLGEVLGKASPAEATLKRWKAKGRFKRAELGGGDGKRATYRWDEVLRIVQAAGARPGPIQSPVPRRAPGLLDDSLLQGLAERVAEILRPALVSEIGARDHAAPAARAQASDSAPSEVEQALRQAVADLVATRKDLMLRYDGQLQRLKAELESYQQRERAMQTFTLELERLKGQIRDLAAAVATRR